MSGQQHSRVEGVPVDPLVGSWSPQWSMGDGEPTSAADLRDVVLTFADGRCEVTRAGSLIRSGTYVNDRKISPKTIDVHFTESDVRELIDAPLRGIYEVSADKLCICYGPAGGGRAVTFSGEKGTGQYLAQYSRA